MLNLSSHASHVTIMN